MHTTGSYLYTLLERIRAYVDEPDLDAKFTDDWIIRHSIGPSQVDVLARLRLTTGCEVVLIYDLVLHEDVEFYRLAPCVQQVKRLTLVNEDGVPTFDVTPRDIFHRNGPGWAIEGNPGALLIRIDVPPAGVENAEIWYTSNGDISPHYSSAGGEAVDPVSVSSASWDEDTLTLTKAAGFAGYTFAEGDRLTVPVATGGTLGDYDITGKTDDNNITLRTGIGAGASNISARIWCRQLILDSAPALGALDLREGGYNGMTLRIIPGAAVRTQELQISAHTFTPPGIWRVETRTPFDPGAAPTDITYEIAPPAQQALYEAISLASAMKLGAARKISQAHQQALALQYRMAMKTIGDNLTNIQGRVPRHIEKDTMDNPLSYSGGWAPLR